MNILYTDIYYNIHSIYRYIPCTNTHLRRLTRAIVGIAPQDDLPDLVQNAVSLFEIPLPLFASLVRQVSLQEGHGVPVVPDPP